MLRERFEGGGLICIEIFSIGLVKGFSACLQQVLGELMVGTHICYLLPLCRQAEGLRRGLIPSASPVLQQDSRIWVDAVMKGSSVGG